MAVSGTVGTTSLDVISLIEKAIRKCGKVPSTVDAETLIDAQSELFVMTQALINDGIPLWTIVKKIIGVHQNQNPIPMPTGTVDIINALYRTNYLPAGGSPASSAGGNANNAFDQNLNTACTQTAPDGNISYNFLNPVVITTVGYLPNSTGDLNLTYETSLDGTNWSPAILPSSAASTFTAGTWYWQDIPQANFYSNAQYFRVRETSGGTLDATEIVFGTAPYALPMSRQNKDDYQNLPNKQSIGRPLQFWFDRQLTPQMWVWQLAMTEFGSIEAWTRREIMDVGSFTNTLEFPARWLDDIITELAARISLVPGIKADPQRITLLQSMAAKSNMRAWTEERDNSPVFYSPNIRGYTR